MDDLEKQALEVLVLKQDAALAAAFRSFFGASGTDQKLEHLEALSVALRTMARAELDRLRAAIAQEEDLGGDDDDYYGVGDAGEDEAPAAGGTKTSVTITEEDESYEDDEGDDSDSSEEGSSDPLAAMTKALSSTLDHLGLPPTVKV